MTWIPALPAVGRNDRIKQVDHHQSVFALVVSCVAGAFI